MSEAQSLFSVKTIRDRCRKILDLGLDGKLEHFTVDLDKLHETALFVVSVIKENYPSLEIQDHSRVNHFNSPGHNRWQTFLNSISKLTPEEKGVTTLDLIVTSVLLDAGAGDNWKYYDDNSKKSFTRSEGLGIASFNAFNQGLFSSDEKKQADAKGLAELNSQMLATAFQHSDSNELRGLQERTQLLNQLSKALSTDEIFLKGTSRRIGNIFYSFAAKKEGDGLKANDVFQTLLMSLNAIWPSRFSINSVGLGDCWKHSQIKTNDATDGYIPFHKLTMWMTYSVVHALKELGIAVAEQNALCGLAEYRNGGLMLDSGLVVATDKNLANTPLKQESETIVEWRALTISLLDLLAEECRKIMSLSRDELTMAKVLEGGTWAAGRKIAMEKRGTLLPPLQIVTDGTLF